MSSTMKYTQTTSSLVPEISSFKCTILNNIANPIILGEIGLSSGIWKHRPPTTIEIDSNNYFEASCTDLAKTRGFVNYIMVGGASFKVSWTVPRGEGNIDQGIEIVDPNKLYRIRMSQGPGEMELYINNNI